jgi:uncharacterized membrane protein YcaP (DUF421 family)
VESFLTAAFFRTLLFYFLLLFSVRLMGKRELSSLSPADLVVAILLAELASIPIENHDIPVLAGVVSIMTIVLLELLLAFLGLKSVFLRKLVEGEPITVIKDGIIDREGLKKARYNLDELIGQLREKGWHDPSDIQEAVLENNGEISIFPKANRRALRADDLGINPAKESMPVILIKDGRPDTRGLERCGKDITWLDQELKSRGIRLEEVFFCYLNSECELIVQPFS